MVAVGALWLGLGLFLISVQRLDDLEKRFPVLKGGQCRRDDTVISNAAYPRPGGSGLFFAHPKVRTMEFLVPDEIGFLAKRPIAAGISAGGYGSGMNAAPSLALIVEDPKLGTMAAISMDDSPEAGTRVILRVVSEANLWDRFLDWGRRVFKGGGGGK